MWMLLLLILASVVRNSDRGAPQLAETHRKFFTEPTAALPCEVVLARRSDQSPTKPKTWGPSCCPVIYFPEIPWAYVLSTSEFISKGTTPVLEPFRRGLLSAQLRFVVVDNKKERYWKHHQIRKDFKALIEENSAQPMP